MIDPIDPSAAPGQRLVPARADVAIAPGLTSSGCSRAKSGPGGSAFRRVAFSLALISGPLLLGSGCARFEARPYDPAREARQLDERRLDAEIVRTFLDQNGSAPAQWPPAAWTLPQLTLAALRLHPDLEVARAVLAEAEAGIETAGARPNPTVGVTPEYNFNPASGVSPWIATVQFDLPIETAGKRGLRIDQARHAQRAAQNRFSSAAWRIRAGVRDALITLAEVQGHQARLQAQVDAFEALLKTTLARLEAGDASAGEAALARSQLARAQSALAESTSATSPARINLARALGLPLQSLPANHALPLPNLQAQPQTPPRPSGPTGAAPSNAVRPASQPPLPTGLSFPAARTRALTARPDLLAALADHAAAESALQLEIARQYPDVHLGTGYQWDQGENKWALGLTVELPILNRNTGPIAEAKARRDATAARALALQFAILHELESARAAWAAAQERLFAARQAAQATADRATSLKAQLDAGAVPAAEWLASQVESAQDASTIWAAEIAALRAEAQLEDAMQYPLADAHSASRPTPSSP